MSAFSFAVSVSVVAAFLTSGAAKVLRGTFTSDLANYRLLLPASVVATSDESNGGMLRC